MLINNIDFRKCSDKKLLKVLEKITKLEKYCKLIPGSLGVYVNLYDTFGPMPSQYKDWLKLFNGGFLFSVSIASTLQKHPKFSEELMTYKDINSKEFKEGNLLPNEFVCIGITIYGNIIGYERNNPNEYIFEWDTDEDSIVGIWNCFSDWLEEQVENAIDDIKDGLLSPFEDLT